jgi:hypothetical protein
MNGKDRLDRLDLDDHGIVDEHVNSIAQFNGDSFIHNGKDLLRLYFCAYSGKFIPETLAVRPFEKPGSQSRVNSVSGTENAMSGFAVNQARSVSVRVRVLRVGAFGEQVAVHH